MFPEHMSDLDTVRDEGPAGEWRDAAAANPRARGAIARLRAHGGAHAGLAERAKRAVGDELRHHVAAEGHEGVARARHDTLKGRVASGTDHEV